MPATTRIPGHVLVFTGPCRNSGYRLWRVAAGNGVRAHSGASQAPNHVRHWLRSFVFAAQPAHCAVHSPASWPVMTLRRFQVLIAAIHTTKAAKACSS
jgi:hypothetical protein